ncbi:MAG: hypothetical protein OXD49_02410 [Candidatus Poribacteria bacterium]|nr:hypothetical protein [Candidatus Poribacteria bacterium]
MEIDIETARKIVGAHDQKKPSEVAKAVNVLYQAFGTYQSITREMGKSDKFWIVRHRISQLPVGILWKVDEGYIGIEQAYQITRLKQEEDKWILAIAIVEVKGLTAKECGKVVNVVLNGGKSIMDSLSILVGIHFDEIQPLSLPLGSDIWTEICKIAWTQRQKWEDLCYQLVRQGVDVNIQEVASQLEGIAVDLRRSGRT